MWIDKLPFQAVTGWMPPEPNPARIVGAVALPGETRRVTLDILLLGINEKVRAMIVAEPDPGMAILQLRQRLSAQGMLDSVAWTEQAEADPVTAMVGDNPAFRNLLADSGVLLHLPGQPAPDMLERLATAAEDPWTDFLDNLLSAEILPLAAA